MCGIAGIYDPRQTPSTELLEQMAATMRNRGPDDQGILARGRIGLVHRRLSVIDLAGGHQPMLNATGTLAIVFNGEIYDHELLRESLMARGRRFRSRSDTEVLLHLYEEYGLAMVEKLNGMFAFAICHLDSGKIVLARDRLGQKPLFYATEPSRLAWASGPAALRALPWVDSSINTQAIHDYLEYLYVPSPASIYEGIRKLPPGHTAVWEDGKLTVQPYWQPQLTGRFTGSYEEACHSLRTRLTRAVKRRLVADVPLGMFLSGGMDSSLITALAQEASAGQVQTFAIGFPDKDYDERMYAQRVADKLGTEHHFLEVQPGEFDRLTRIVADFEEPFADSSMLPTWLLCEFTRGQVTVALSGDAADELFGGYYRYRVMRLSSALNAVPKALRVLMRSALLRALPTPPHERTPVGRLRRLAEICASDDMERYMRLMSRCPSPAKEALYGNRMLSSGPHTQSIVALNRHVSQQSRLSLVDRIMELELSTYLDNDILVKVDRCSMAHGLEVRSPFLDPEVVDLALRLPYGWKQSGRTRKRILADTFAASLPSDVFSRRKMGFGVPVARWLREDWADPVRDLLLGGELVKQEWFDADAVARLVHQHIAQEADHSYAIYTILMLELWLRGQ